MGGGVFLTTILITRIILIYTLSNLYLITFILVILIFLFLYVAGVSASKVSKYYAELWGALQWWEQ